MKRKRVYRFEAAGWDKVDRRAHTPEDGTEVFKTQPAGVPSNGTMGHCFVADAETGAFIGLVQVGSLKQTGRTVRVRKDRGREVLA